MIKAKGQMVILEGDMDEIISEYLKITESIIGINKVHIHQITLALYGSYILQGKGEEFLNFIKEVDTEDLRKMMEGLMRGEK